MIPIEVDQSERVYWAEESVQPATNGRYFESMGEVTTWVQAILVSAWFQNRYPSVLEIRLRDGRGNRRAWCWQHDEEWLITLPRPYRYELMILHELSHVVAGTNHDREFCATYLEFVRRFLGKAAWEDLLLQFVLERVVHRRRRQPNPWQFDIIGAIPY
jgi:putative metallohydrolase (TIGR04338 family)